MDRRILTVLLNLIFVAAIGQGTYIDLNTDSYRYIDRLDIKYGKILSVAHTNMKPFQRSDVAAIAESMNFSTVKKDKITQFQLQYLMDENAEWLDSAQSIVKHPFVKHLYTEPASFFHVSSKKKGLFDLRINPVFDINMGAESKDGRFIFSSARGIEFRGNIKKVLSFYVSAFGNAARFPSYVADRYITGGIPNSYLAGQAYYKEYSSAIFKFKDGVNYWDARGYINLNILKYINLQFGRDKNFIGNGMRSLFLSDNSAPYLFLKFKLRFWRIDYQSIFAQLTSQYTRLNDVLLPKKYVAIHHLNVRVTHYLDIGLFESVTFKRRDNSFELQYLNPIIFYRAVEHALGSPDKEQLGLDFKLNLINHMSFYGQFLLNEFNVKHFFSNDGWWGNKYAFQLGLKYIDIVPNLDAQLEFNYVRPYMYTHEDSANYTNYNQPLAHPLGANFLEMVANVHYQPAPKWGLNLRMFFAKVGEDSTTNGIPDNFGGNILLPSVIVSDTSHPYGKINNVYGNHVGQGISSFISYAQFTLSYQPWHNIYVETQLLYRNKSSNHSTYSQSTFYFGIGTRINIAAKNFEF